MKQYIRTFVVAAAVALAASGVARAHDDDEDGKPCSKSTLRGLYVFNPSGFDIVAGSAQPTAVFELIDFMGNGNLNTPKATVSANGAIFHASDVPGTYTVASDCTGTLTFNPMGAPPIHFDLFVAFHGSQAYMIRTDPDTVLQGTAERVSR
jgi:hypothetical protein